MTKIKLSPLAISQRAAAISYISGKLASPLAANPPPLKEIKRKIDFLKLNPEAGIQFSYGRLS